MPVQVDPENNETRAVRDKVDFTGQRVLEVVTWRYADRAEHVAAIDPKAEAITSAMENRPDDDIAEEDPAAKRICEVYNRVEEIRPAAGPHVEVVLHERARILRLRSNMRKEELA